MPRPRIVADRNIALLAESFGPLGEVSALPASRIDAAAVREADLLLVRSTVKVGAPLVEGSRVRFVGSAVAGTDHVDEPYLQSAGIAFASAPGSNAPSVAQWFAGALLTIAVRRGRPLAGLTVGVVGVGHVGRRVEAACAALGLRVLRSDPPRARREGEAGFASLDELCERADVVTLHVPLVEEGPDRTRALFDASRLAKLRPGAWLLNASRGVVVDGAAAIAARSIGRDSDDTIGRDSDGSRGLGALVLDVFPGEPTPDPALVAACDLATPHVAGHSIDGKAAGTEAVYRAACAHLGKRASWSPRRSLPPLPTAAVALDARALSDEAAALAVLRHLYRVEDDDRALRSIVALPLADRAAAFQRYREEYPARREPIGLSVSLRPARPRALALLETLGAIASG